MTSERFIDTGEEPIQSLPSIDEFQNDRLLSLEEAIFSVQKWIPYPNQIVGYAKKKSSKPKDGLTIDESASIYVYAMEKAEPEHSICLQLDRAFHSKEKIQLQSWFPYIELFLTALKKLPSIKCTVYRGVRGDVWDQYQQDYIWWRGFSCCTNSVTQMKKILGSKGKRTIFEIHCINGKNVQNHSSLQDKNEIVLMPNTYLRVLGKRNLGSELYMIGLQEEQIPDEIIASSESLPPSSTKKIYSNEPHLKDTNQSNGQQSFIQTCGMRDLSKAHPKCQFQAEQYWFECQYHADDNQLIKKPDELERNIQDPPPKFNSDVMKRIQGSIIGMSLGDALGAHVEFRPRKFLLEHPVEDLEGGGTWGLEKGQFTDDTSMALCLAISLVNRHDFVLYDQLVRYKWWYKNGYMSSTGSCFDIGAATKQSICEFERRQKQFTTKYDISLDQIDFLSDSDLLKNFDVYCSEDGVAGNGALMRLAPVPLFFYKFPQYAIELSGRSGMITHGDRKAYDACRYYGALIVAALHNETKEQLLDNHFYSKHEEWFSNNLLCPEIMNIAEGSYKRKGGYDEGIRGKGYIVDALEAALWAFWCDGDSFEKGALAAVNLGDDTDTTAAIYGQLAGAYYGYEKLPQKWIKFVYAKKFMECLSKWIAYEGEKWQPNSSIMHSVLSSLPNNDSSMELSTSPKFNINTEQIHTQNMTFSSGSHASEASASQNKPSESEKELQQNRMTANKKPSTIMQTTASRKLPPSNSTTINKNRNYAIDTRTMDSPQRSQRAQTNSQVLPKSNIPSQMSAKKPTYTSKKP
ncbi:unnamed protein product [Adineta steineri]|uniref:ADP-ribosylhydrolase ARH3 n=1 Tax=Adineta steineri TaxID=433720 RepID=A0A815CJS9_9BILA|nr:unnamed protein product [Adineta steineri]CAF1471473.1 unnamed protein product [Adineta steineri]CAF3681370.1 unnamed protein product [Adineta steineri]CAF3792058.1 unnamed protein product [Adineta steineri]CAF3927834.1 unnamed protein product [Adineta steineri]